MKAISEFYQSLVCKSNKQIGAEISWLEHSIEMFKQAQTKSGRTLFQELMSKAQRNLTEAKKDNDFIYHERVPDIKSLDSIGKAQPAKVLHLACPMSQNFKGRYKSLFFFSIYLYIIRLKQINKLRFFNCILCKVNQNL